MNDFIPPHIDWAAVSPVLIVLGAGVVGVLVEAFVPARARRTVQLVLSLGALAGAVVAVALLWETVHDHALLVVGDSYDLTPFGLGIQGIVAILAFLAVLVMADRSSGQDAFAPTAAAVPGSRYEEEARRAGLQQTEVFPLTLFSTGGMLLFAATDDLIILFIALEVLSLPLYVLCATARRRRLLSQEAAFKYFLLGAFASALTIFGIALLYGFAGSVHLPVIADALAGRGDTPLQGLHVLAVTGILLVSAGLLFKVGAAPFHTWTPDVYTGAPTPVTGFMAACTKAAAFGALVRVLFYLGQGFDAPTRHEVQVLLWAVALLTMAIGTIVGVVQTDIKRLLAYSSIAHAGFVLVALVGFAEPGAGAVLFYLLAYGLATVGAFAVVGLVRERLATGAGEADAVILGEATHLAQWAGIGRKAPWLTAAFALFLLSMAGIPLTAGFIGKFQVFSAAVDAGAWPLALAGVIASAVAVFFYVRIIVLMVLTPAADAAVEGHDGGAAAPVPGEGTGTLTQARPVARAVVTVMTGWGPATVVVTLCAIGVILLGVLPSWVLDLAAGAVKFVP
ncbi:NADH-quinone oxidoreductase subunit NuoN [Xylanimonas protaetiae]|uniref:NADH-quinone oxidoreductase subunit N n=1 Tax=Xylanimonas protaetiae TaxID=2509457 RepID=A0A4P6F3Q7_9MICO|nr:NADH-quinone oxidoreductase subunit NuoN [Xylanimonas protaetiae]QAY69946.1 NADH-quinone oxidoreductase subunit NuoN [Xylanimonas protaetiae]